MAQDVKSRVADAKARVARLRDAKVRIEERRRQEEERLRALIKELKDKGLPTKISELDALLASREAECQQRIVAWEQKLTQVETDLKAVKQAAVP